MAVHYYWEAELKAKDPEFFDKRLAHWFFEDGQRSSTEDPDALRYSGWQTSESPRIDEEAEWVRELAFELIDEGILEAEEDEWDDEFASSWELFRQFLADDSVFVMRLVRIGNGPMGVHLYFGTNKNSLAQSWSLDHAEDDIVAKRLADPAELEEYSDEEDE